jgi:biopolymer transport protein ExbB/TolQ
MTASPPIAPARRPGVTLAAFVLGLPLAAGILALVHVPGPWSHPLAERYLSHPIAGAEVVLFCCALGGLCAKWWLSGRERRAARRRLLPAWDGQPVPVSEALGLLACLPRGIHKTYLGRRFAAVLDFVCQRRSADDLDQHLRALADNDAVAQENSYGLLRFITWAIPILGFLGTVLGITQAIAGITPETLEQSLSGLTGGLALAFDSTALALTLTMIVMFLTFLAERREQALLEAVDDVVERELGHRFQREGKDSAPFVEALHRNTAVLLSAVEELVHRQASVWADAFAQAEQQTREQQHRVAGAIESALERTAESHARRLEALESQASVQGGRLAEQLARIAKEVAGQGVQLSEELYQLREGEGQLLRLQQSLQHNLHVLAASGTFEQAIHSLTAAVHLLTARAQAEPPAIAPLPSHQPPRAA